LPPPNWQWGAGPVRLPGARAQGLHQTLPTGGQSGAITRFGVAIGKKIYSDAKQFPNVKTQVQSHQGVRSRKPDPDLQGRAAARLPLRSAISLKKGAWGRRRRGRASRPARQATQPSGRESSEKLYPRIVATGRPGGIKTAGRPQGKGGPVGSARPQVGHRTQTRAPSCRGPDLSYRDIGKNLDICRSAEIRRPDERKPGN